MKIQEDKGLTMENIFSQEKEIAKFKLNKIAARWPAKAVA